MHIPKTSGISVAHALVAAEQPQRVFFGFDRSFFGGFEDFASVAPATRAFIHLTPDTVPREEEVIRAHMALSTLRAAYPAGRFMTVVREPVCRLLSHFLFWRGFTADQLHDWGGWAAFSMLATGRLDAFLGHPEVACQIDNVATRLLLWPHALIPDAGFIDPAHDGLLAEAAWQNLAALDFADAIEAKGFAHRLGAFLGVEVALEPHNVSPPLPAALRAGAAAELTGQARSLLHTRTRLDQILWRRLVARSGENVEARETESRAQGLARLDVMLRP